MTKCQEKYPEPSLREMIINRHDQNIDAHVCLTFWLFLHITRYYQYLYIYNILVNQASYLIFLLAYHSYYFFFNITIVAPAPPSLNPPSLKSTTYLQLFKNIRKEFKTKIRSAEKNGVRIFKGNNDELDYLIKQVDKKYA